MYKTAFFIAISFLWLFSPVHGESARRVTVAAVGDIIFHGALLRQSMTAHSDVPDFSGLWRLLASQLVQPDILYGNLEGPSSPNLPYSADKAGTSMRFNFHPQAIVQLKEAGFDVLGSANNHALDAGPTGVDATIDLLNGTREGVGMRAEMAHFGVHRTDEASEQSSVAVLEKNGFRFVFIGCTYGVNGYGDFHPQVVPCYKRGTVEPDLQLLSLISRYANESETSGVIFTPHWGLEYREVSRAQVTLAQAAIDAGAMVVVGHHPHVLQRYEQYKGKYIFYSLGSFISNQFPQNRTYRKRRGDTVEVRRHHERLSRRLSAMLFLEIVNDNAGSKGEGSRAGKVALSKSNVATSLTAGFKPSAVRVKSFKVLPLYMKIGAPGYGAEGAGRLDQLYGEKVSGKRTLVPLYIERFTGQADGSSQLKNLRFRQPLSLVTDRNIEKVIRDGSYSLAQNMKLAHDLATEIFPMDG